MQPIVSSTSKEHVVRLLIFLVAGLGAGGYFLYDGLVGYSNDNVERLVQGFDPVPKETEKNQLKAAVRKDITEATADEIAAGESIDAVKEKLGEPSYVDRGGEGKLHYLGNGGVLTIRRDGDTVKTPVWKDGPHRASDIFLQFVYAGICGVVAIIAGGFVLRAVSQRTALGDDGLKVAGHDKISWDAMQSLDARDYQKKGWVDLRYQKAGATRTARLDSYKIAKFREIITAMCERKGFENPLASANANA